MKIKKLKLYTNKLESEFNFYSKVLGFEIIEKTVNSFTAKVGFSEFCFEKSECNFQYHYCFLIHSNHLKQALDFIEKRIEVLRIDGDNKIQRFESWNANSFYFFDASGNLAEFIVRFDLNNESKNDFSISNILGINEIGIPTRNIEQTNGILQKSLKTKFWKGDKERFGTNGTQEGLFLLPNYTVKKTWFPTELKIRPNNFDAIVENLNKKYRLSFKDEILKISELL
ncbi:VOC family protein [Frigoriflavimonas asaccharolytica]|uniref:Catechol-2,3-dioxygenase n=1 Tax=Frigoriflavimonas asaccharolytica TaxID=2735899 RepID=A0A8J8GAV9_9FLAO|nr:glyoxalase [Frigoriflavimonas asaccharolytica]NRS92834.1 catechol-2,3-dioxygenase [Frigoriflavimonas asaccharolytica]